MEKVQLLHSLLGKMLSPENAIRKESEAAYTAWKLQNPLEVMQDLLMLLDRGIAVEVRSMAAVLLRKLISDSDYSGLSREIQTEEESERLVARNIADLISSIAFFEVTWPELMPFLNELCSHSDFSKRELGFYLLSSLASLLIENLVPSMNSIASLCLATLTDSRCSGSMFEQIMNVTSELVTSSESGPAWESLRPLFSTLLSMFPKLLADEDEDTLRQVLMAVMDIAADTPTFLKTEFSKLVQFCSEVSAKEEYSNDTREICVETIDVFSETSPQMIRRYKPSIKAVFQSCLQFLSEIPETPDWEKTDGKDELANDHHTFAREIICHFSSCLGKDITSQPFNEIITPCLRGSRWNIVYAALIALASYGQGVASDSNVNLADFMNIVVPFLNHQNLRVRYAALEALDVFSASFEGEIHELYCDSLLSILVAVVQDGALPLLLRGKAMAVVEMFCNDNYLKEENVLAYYEPILQHSLSILIHPQATPFIQEEVLGAVASLSTLSDFTPYYDAFMPKLIAVVSNAHGRDYVSLRSKAIECIGILAEAVGVNRFRQDSKQILELLLGERVNIQYDDPCVSPVLRTCVRICETLGKEFIPYLNVILPAIIQMANKVEDDDEEEDAAAVATGSHDNEDAKPSSSSAIEERIQGCEMLKDLAKVLGDDFYPYLSESVKPVLAGLPFQMSDQVRSQCALYTSTFLKCILNHDKTDTTASLSFFKVTVEALMKQIEMEDDCDTLCCQLQAINEMFEMAAMSGGIKSDGSYKDPILVPPTDFVEQVISLLFVVGEKSNARRAELIKRRMKKQSRSRGRGKAAAFQALDDEDEDDSGHSDKELEELEDELLYNLEETFGSIIKIYKDAMLGFFRDRLITFFQRDMSSQNTSPSQISAMLCLQMNAMEAFSDPSPYFGFIYPIILKNVLHENAILRQISVYGFGMMAIRYPQGIRGDFSKILSLLKESAAHSRKRLSSYKTAHENAISSMGKMLHYLEECRSQAQYWDWWMEGLPIEEDATEGIINHQFLLEELSKGNTFIAQPKHHLRLAITLCRILLGTQNREGDPQKLGNEETLVLVPGVLRSLFESNPELSGKALGNFTKDEQRTLASL